MLKKSSIIWSSYGSAQGVYLPGTSSCQCRTRPRSSRQLTRPQFTTCRGYSMVNDGPSRHNHGVLRWPELTSTDAIPTPYQIFNQKKGSPYSKQRFYELVKLYHPDRHGLDTSVEGLSCSAKLERYRLVVAANDILSDPVKRGAYDCYGAGWNGQPDVMSTRNSSGSTYDWGSYSGRGWGGGPGGPSQNATWEDWERWYQRDSNGKQEPTFVSNSAFLSLIVILAALGGIGQVTRAGHYSMNVVAQVDARHDEMSKELRRIRQESTESYGSRQERIYSFLKQRDPYGTSLRDETYRKLLSAPEVCSSGDIKGRSMDVHRQNHGPNGR